MTTNKIKELIQQSKGCDTIHAKLINGDSIISMTMASSINLGSNDLILEFNLKLGDNNLMVSGMRVDSIKNILGKIDNNVLSIDINI